ncbi:aminotransferase-like domain-containing protein [Roseibium sp. LAB1]
MVSFKYQSIAQTLAELIDNGTLKPGERFPSLRRTMRSYSVSLSTANQAYAQLEDKGYIRAQAKSGYFVTRPASCRLVEPDKTTPPESSRNVLFRAPYLEMLEHASNPAYVPLGCAIPAPSLLAAEPLNALQARLLRSKGQQLNTYGSAQGLPDLRREIAKLMSLHGSTVSQDEIVVTSGCTEALGLALQTLTQPGDTIAVESPAYFGLLQVLERLKLKAWELPTSRDGIDPAALEQALNSGTVTAVALSSSFTNPLGTMMPEPVKRAVLKLLDQHKTPLIEDDTYGGLGFGGCRPAPFFSLPHDIEIFYCSSFSKTLAPGYRTGWVRAPGRVDQLTKAKFAASICNPTAPQLALAEFLASRDFERHVSRMARVMETNVERARRAIAQSFPMGTRATRPDGGFVLWLELNKIIDTTNLYTKSLKEKICFAPGRLFTASGLYANCLRLSCGDVWSDATEAAIARLGSLVAAELEEQQKVC